MSEKTPSPFILGIDPGSRVAGYAIIAGEEKNFSIVDSGVCKLDGKADFFARLDQLSQFFADLTKDLGPFEVSIEALAYVKNVNSFAKLAQARGAIISSLFSRSVGVFEYPPNLVKSTVAGYGHASKQSIQKTLGFTGKATEFATHDESDAVAIALCHHFMRNSPGREIPKASKGRSIKSAFKGRIL